MRSSASRFLALLGVRLGVRGIETGPAVAAAAAFFVALAVILLSSQATGFSFRIRASGGEAGRVAEKDFVVDRDFTYVDERATELKKEARRRIVPPVYRVNEEISADALGRLDTFSAAYRTLTAEGSSEEKMYLRLQVEFPGLFDRAGLRLMRQRQDMDRVFDKVRSVLRDALASGVVDVRPHREEIRDAGAIELWKSSDGKISVDEVSLDALDTVDNLSLIRQEHVAASARSETERRLVLLLAGDFAAENAFYDAQGTEQHRSRAADSVDPVSERLAKGQVLARKGDVISEVTAAKIRSLGEYANTVNANGIAGSALFLLVLFAAALFLFAPRGAASFQPRTSQALLLLGMGLVSLVLGALLLRLVPLPGWLPPTVVVPISAFSILATILVSTSAGISFSLVSSLAFLLLTGMNPQAFLFAFLSGLAGTAVVLEADRRIDLIRAGLILSVLDSALLAVLGLLANFDPGRFLVVLGWGLANGFSCGVLSLGFLPIFEHMLNAPTRFRLMELSDLNSPIFKRMLSLAPGTYTHSISVANLAETACEAIGANALLARVSAYYHDIGKIDQADYFIENQKTVNRHDEMKASLSVAVIKSHVRIGIEKAKELSLPQAIVDIIAQHHGRGLITYFYHRAVSEEKNARVSRDDFSYPGVRPRTREAAVLMLADAVEAASRVLRKPTVERLDKLVHDTIMAKFNSGELGDSSLTLRDLETIRRSFVHILEGYFHTRIEYPKLKEEPQGKAAARRTR